MEPVEALALLSLSIRASLVLRFELNTKDEKRAGWSGWAAGSCNDKWFCEGASCRSAHDLSLAGCSYAHDVSVMSKMKGCQSILTGFQVFSECIF